MENKLSVSTYNALDFICSYGALEKLAGYAKNLGKNAWLLGSAQGFRRAGVCISQILEENSIGYGFEIFSGYPTEEKALAYAEEIKAIKADFVIAMGGGRVLDEGKRAASLAGVPVITVPTISATNAAYRRNSMMYNDKGHYLRGGINEKSPLLVLADAEILQRQPDYCLNAGIIDTMARYYEALPYKEVYGDKLHYRFAIKVAEVMYEYFKENRAAIKEAFSSSEKSQVVLDTVANIIGLCGIDANYVSGIVLQGFAHPFYNQATRVRKEQKKLHGEVIGFGILVQLLLEGVPEEKWQEEFELLRDFGFDYTLRDMGLDAEMTRKLVANLWNDEFPTILFLSHVQSEAEILAAIAEVDKRIYAARGNIFMGDWHA